MDLRQVSSDFQAYKHVDIIGPGEYARAHTPLEATLSFHPTVVLTNALPHSMDVIIWQVREPSASMDPRQGWKKVQVTIKAIA
jgi:hypothetical protein